MNQIWIRKAGGPEVLELRQAADPVPGPGELTIRVRAAGVNFADVLARMGMYPDAPRIPCVVGYEVAGEVVGIGAGVDGYLAGDRVVALTRFGGYSTMVGVPQAQVFRIPHGMSFSQAAAIPVNYFTAYLAIVRFGNAQPGERVLVHNAGGGVGIAAVQLCRRVGARVYGTASGWKHERLRELGVDEVIDYRTVDWKRELRRLTADAGVHLIVDPIGGRNLRRDLDSLAPLGRLVAFGFSEPVRGGGRSLLRSLVSLLAMPRPHVLSLLNENRMVGGLNLGHLWTELERLRVVGNRVLEGWDEGWLEPEIAAEVAFKEVARAHRMLQERRNIGKVVLVPE